MTGSSDGLRGVLQGRRHAATPRQLKEVFRQLARTPFADSSPYSREFHTAEALLGSAGYDNADVRALRLMDVIYLMERQTRSSQWYCSELDLIDFFTSKVQRLC